MSDEIDDLFADEVEVAPSVASSPRLLQVIISLVIVGLLVGVAVIVVVSGLSSVTGVRGGSAVCDGAPSCTDLSLDDVRSLSAIDLPDGSEVVESFFVETDALITLTARVYLPDGAPDPFDGTGYGEISTPTIDWPVDDLTVLAYYAATGEQGTLNAEAVFAVDDRVREVVLVQVTRVLD